MNDTSTNPDGISSPQGDYDALRHVSAESPCPYLPDRQSRNEAYLVERLDGAMYERLLGRGFRRSGHAVYRPRCRGCSDCRAIRIPTELFGPTRSMRRIQRANADVRVECGDPEPTAEKYRIFLRYLDSQHDDTMTRDYQAYVDFLYDSPTTTCEFSYCLGDRLIGASLVDCWSTGYSSVYMYFDPEFAERSLGTFSVLWEVEYARVHGVPYYYLGFWVADSSKMAYKSRFRPNEVLVGDDRWVGLRE